MGFCAGIVGPGGKRGKINRGACPVFAVDGALVVVILKPKYAQKTMKILAVGILSIASFTLQAQVISWNFDGYGDISGPGQQAGMPGNQPEADGAKVHGCDPSLRLYPTPRTVHSSLTGCASSNFSRKCRT